MELWIRSQNKHNLMKANDIVVRENAIVVYKETEKDTEVARYKTEERALEVLNEIQDLLKPKIIISDENQLININGFTYSIDKTKNINTDIQELSSYVYEMPEE